MSFTTHKEQIEAFMSDKNADVSKIKTCVEEVIEAVDKGKLRVASPVSYTHLTLPTKA